MIRTLLLLLILGLTVQAQATTLKIATLVPDGTTWMKLMRSGAKEIKARTEGRVKLRFYPGGVMGNDSSVLRKIRVGQLHGGVLTAGGLVPIYADTQIYSIPYLFRSFDEVDTVRRQIDPLIIAGLRNKGFISYGLSEGGFAFIMSKKPISRIDQLRTQKVWTPEGDQTSLSAFEALGVSPIPLPLTDVLTGLQTGLINTIGASPVAAIALQWHTKIKYITEMPVLYFYGTLILKQKALKKISDSDRKILREVLEKSFKEIDRKTRNDNQKAHQALLDQGIKPVTPTAAEIEQWHSTVGRVLTEMDRKGSFSKTLLAQIRQLLAESRGSR